MTLELRGGHATHCAIVPSMDLYPYTRLSRSSVFSGFLPHPRNMPGGGFANPDQDKDDLINDRDVIYTIGIVLVQKIRAAVFILFVCSLTMGYPNTFSNAFGQNVYCCLF